MPGKPTGQHRADTIRISCSPSSDASAITYRVYREGGTSPIGETAGTNWTDTGLVRRLDPHLHGGGRSTPSATRAHSHRPSDPITTPLPPDTEAPDKPAAPTGVSNTTDSIDVSWTATIGRPTGDDHLPALPRRWNPWGDRDHGD